MFQALIRDRLAGHDAALARALEWLLGHYLRTDNELCTGAWHFARLASHAICDGTVLSLSRAVTTWLKIREALVVRGKLDLLFQHLPQDWKDLEKDLVGTEWWYPVVCTPCGFMYRMVVTTADGPRFSSPAQAHAWWGAEPEHAEERIRTRAEKYRFSASRPYVARWDRTTGEFVDHQMV